MASKIFSIKHFNVSCVFKSRYPKQDISFRSDWAEWELGLFLKPSKMVGTKDFKHPKNWNQNLVRSYRLGINLLIFKMWIEVDRGGFHIKE